MEENLDSTPIVNNLCDDIPISSETNPSDGVNLKDVEGSGASSPDSGISSIASKDLDVEDEWLDIMGSGDFKKKILKPGLGSETRPEKGDRVTINVKYYLNDELIEENENQKLIVGDLDVFQGLDLVLCLMEKGEIAKVIIPPKLAYGKIGRSPDIPPGSSIDCEIELKDVEYIDEASLTVAERLQLGEGKRLRGNYYYERTDYIDAVHCYERAASYLEGIRDSSGSTIEESQKIIDMQVKVYNNMAASHLKLSAYPAALKSVDSVLKVQPKNVKALFRKAKILGSLGSTEEAISCLKYAATLEPDTKIIQTELAKLRSQKKKEDQSQKAMYKRMFPQNEVKKKNNSFSKFFKWGALSAGVAAAVVGMLVYRQAHS